MMEKKEIEDGVRKEVLLGELIGFHKALTRIIKECEGTRNSIDALWKQISETTAPQPEGGEE